MLARKLNIGQLLSFEVVDGLIIREVEKIVGHARLLPYLLARAVFLRALAMGSSGDSTILAARLSRVTLLSPLLCAS